MSVSIQEIPRFVIEEIYELIGEKTKEKLHKYVLSDAVEPAASIDAYIRKIMIATFFTNEDVVDLLSIKGAYHRRRQTTKKNWLKQLKADVEAGKQTPIHIERDVIESLLERKGTAPSIRDALSAADAKDYVRTRLAEIEAWSVDGDSRLTDFSYLDTKLKYQIEKAFENDIVCIICEFLRNAPKNWITHRAKDLIENPVFSNGPAKMTGNLIFEGDSKLIVSPEIKLSDDRLFRALISVEPNEEVKLEKFFSLDDTDSEILEHVIEHRDERFYTSKKIVFDIRPLVQRIYGQPSKKSYDLIERRLKKIGKFSLEGRTMGPNKETKSSFLYNLFQSVVVRKEEGTGRIYAEIQFSDALHEQFITNQTVQIYSHFIHRLENRLSKILIYAFQSERLDAYLQGREMRRTFEYSFFADRIRFRSKRLDSNLALVESSLQEFMASNILVKQYKRNGTGFDIELTMLTDSEKADFFSPNHTISLTEGQADA